MSRFERQIPIFGEGGQKKISGAHVAVVGCGGLGCNVINNLALAGIGELTLIDDDTPSESNMNRQFFYPGTHAPKVETSARWVEKVSPETHVEERRERLTENNAAGLIDGCDIVVDCLDSMSSRLALNKAIVDAGVPMVHGGVQSMYGQVMVVVPGKTPCLACFMKEFVSVSIPSLSSAVSTVAGIQSNEVLKMITGVGETLSGRLLILDLETNSIRIVLISRNSECCVCKEKY